MKIFGKHIFRSIKANPFQPILITFIISLCVAVILLSVALPVNIYKNERGAMRADEWTADLEITLKSTGGRRLIFDDEVEEAVSGRGSVIGEFSLTGFFTPENATDKRQVQLGAFDLVDAVDFYSIRTIKLGKLTNLNLKTSAIISESFAEEHGLTIMDDVKINILGREFCYTVQAIAEETGILKRTDMLVDISGVRSTLAERSLLIASLPYEFNPYTKIHVRLNDGVDPQEIKSELEGIPAFSDKRIDLPKDDMKSDYEVMLLTVTLAFPAFLLIVVASLMTVSTLDLLQKKRQSDAALFRAAGADVRHLNKILYLEGLIYGVVGGAIGSLLAMSVMPLINRLYGFRYSQLTFGPLHAILGISVSVVFSTFCAFLYIKKQRRKSVSDGLRLGNLNTDAFVLRKALIFAVVITSLVAVTVFLPIRARYISASMLSVALVLFIYSLFPYAVGAFSSVVCRILSPLRRRGGDFILAAKSCRNSYPLRHAGRILTILITIFISLTGVLSAVEDHIESYAGIASFDYVGVMADEGTREVAESLEGVVATANANINNNVVVDKDKITIGISFSGDVRECFTGDMLPDKLLTGNNVALSSGLAKMLNAKLGDTVECQINGISCELVLSEIVEAHGDFVFYDADYVGVGYDMLCVRTDGSESAHQSLVAVFDERGVAHLSKDDFFSDVYRKTNSQLAMFKAMFVVMILMTVIGVANVINEQRLERRFEFTVMEQNGKTKRGVLALQAIEITYLIIFSSLMAVMFSGILKYTIDVSAISFGMTLYA